MDVVQNKTVFTKLIQIKKGNRIFLYVEVFELLFVGASGFMKGCGVNHCKVLQKCINDLN